MSRRTRLAVGIYSDRYGRAVVVKTGGKQHERRFPPDTPLDFLTAFRRDWQRELAEPTHHAGTLGADVAAFLATLPRDSTKRSTYTRDCGTWLALPWRDGLTWADRARQSVTPQDIRLVLARWQDEGLAPATVNNRRQALSMVYQVTEGKGGLNPVRDVPRLVRARPEPRAVPAAIIARVLAHLPDRGRAAKGQTRPTRSATKARFLVLATTGLPPAQIMRLTPADVDLPARTVYVRPRRKGAGAPGRTLPLSADAVAAFRAFIAADAWGRYSSRSAATSFARAVAKAKAETLAKGEAWAVPDGFRAYDLRHSFLTQVYAQTRDINAAAELGVHAGFATTRRYVEGAVSATAKAAIAAIQALPSVLPAETRNSRQNPRKRGTSPTAPKTKKPARSRR